MIRLEKSNLNIETSYPFSLHSCNHSPDKAFKNLYDILCNNVEIQNAIFEQILPEKDGQDHSQIYIKPLSYQNNENFINNYVGILSSFFERVYLLKHKNITFGFYLKGVKRDAIEMFNNLLREKMLNKYIFAFIEKFKYYDYTKFDTFHVSLDSKDKSNEDVYINYLKQSVSSIKCVTLHLFGWSIEEIESSPLLYDLFCQFNDVYILFANNHSVGAYLT